MIERKHGLGSKKRCLLFCLGEQFSLDRFLGEKDTLFELHLIDGERNSITGLGRIVIPRLANSLMVVNRNFPVLNQEAGFREDSRLGGFLSWGFHNRYNVSNTCVSIENATF
jgi:hypothetical protein